MREIYSNQIMFKKSINLLFACLIITGIAFTSACESGNGSSGSDSDTTFLESGVKFIYLERGDGLEVDSLMHVTTHINLMVGEDTVWSTVGPGQQKFAFDAQKTSLIPGFDEAVMYAKKGDRMLIVVPPELGYGDEPNGAIPANSTLTFDIDFLDVEKPKIFLSEVLFPVYQTSGVDGLIKHYQSLDLDSTTYEMGQQEWYVLSDKIFRAGDFEQAAAFWEFRLKEIDDLGGYYMMAQAHQNLGDIDKAISCVETGMEVAQDTVGMQFVKSYLEELITLK